MTTANDLLATTPPAAAPDGEADGQHGPVDEALAPLADALVEPMRSPAAAIEAWERLRRQLTQLNRQDKPDAAWVAQLCGLDSRLRQLAQLDPDIGLYLLMQSGGNDPEHYSAHHALLCALVCDICWRWLEWSEEEGIALVRAALTMNLSMAGMQDALAKQLDPLTAVQRDIIARHASASAELLTAAGVEDPLWLEAVRRHDQHVTDDDAIASPSERLAQLLRRVDVYTAKLSRRASRHSTSPTLAARDACLGPAGTPDAIGATMLRCMGLYPPGSFVVLSNGETGVVLRRGPKAHLPIVASLRRSDGGLMLQPMKRTTGERGLAVIRGIPAADARLLVNHLRVLSC